MSDYPHSASDSALSAQPLIPLPYTFISVTGPEAEKFLQGQLSCNLQTLDEHQVSYGTANTPKGRIYGLFKIARQANGFLLRAESSTAETLAKQLKKYQVFFKCTLQIDDQLRAYGLLATPDSLANQPTQAQQLIRLGNELLLICPTLTPQFELWTRNSVTSTNADLTEAWLANETLSGIPELYAATQEQFIVQELNLQHLRAVSFDKGCYTGQEIIARMKFLGKQKKKLFLLRASGHQTALPGSPIVAQDGTKWGELVRSHWSPSTGSVALGVLNIEFAQTAQPVFLSSTGSEPFLVSEVSYPH